MSAIHYEILAVVGVVALVAYTLSWIVGDFIIKRGEE